MFFANVVGSKRLSPRVKRLPLRRKRLSLGVNRFLTRRSHTSGAIKSQLLTKPGYVKMRAVIDESFALPA